MPLIKPTLEADIRLLMTSLATNQDATDAQDKFVKGLASAIDTYIKTALVTVVTSTGPATGSLT